MAKVTDVVYVPSIYRWVRSTIKGPQTLWDVTKHAEDKGYWGVDVTLDGERVWFRQLADGWNVI